MGQCGSWEPCWKTIWPMGIKEPGQAGRGQEAIGVFEDRKQEGGRREMPIMLIKIIINIFLG